MDFKNGIILFSTILVLSLIVLNYSQNKTITSIYTTENFVDSANERLAGVLHSGDILDIADSNDKNIKYMNRQDYNSEIVFTKPEQKNINTNLSKLRIISVNHNDKSIQMPIKFGDTIVLAHNSYIENKNQSRFIKYGEKLQSHQIGEMFRTYKIMNPSNATDTNHVKYDAPIILRKADNSDNGFLTIDKSGFVTSKNPMDKASKLFLKLKRVYEPYENNLCICQDEILYP